MNCRRINFEDKGKIYRKEGNSLVTVFTKGGGVRLNPEPQNTF